MRTVGVTDAGEAKLQIAAAEKTARHLGYAHSPGGSWQLRFLTDQDAAPRMLRARPLSNLHTVSHSQYVSPTSAPPLSQITVHAPTPATQHSVQETFHIGVAMRKILSVFDYLQLVTYVLVRS